MTTVEPATHDDVDRLVELEAGLFREDAGQHERFADVTWPEREGRVDFGHLLGNPSAIVLLAWADTVIVGFAVGYLQPSAPTRLPVTYGVLTEHVVPRAGGSPHPVLLKQIGVDEDPQVRRVAERRHAADSL